MPRVRVRPSSLRSHADSPTRLFMRRAWYPTIKGDAKRKIKPPSTTQARSNGLTGGSGFRFSYAFTTSEFRDKVVYSLDTFLQVRPVDLNALAHDQ
jgi:hypothetical protein